MSDSLNRRYAIKLLANIVTGIINGLLVAIVPKALGPAAYGYFTFLQQFYSQLISFIDTSTSTSFFTKLSARNSRKELIKFYTLFSILLLLVLLLSVFLVKQLGYSAFFLTDIPDEYIYLGLWFGFLTWFTQIFIKISDAYAITVSVEIIKIIHKLLMLGVLLYIVNHLTFDLSLYYYFHFLSMVSFIFVLIFLFNNKGIISAAVLSVKVDYKRICFEFYKFCSPLFLFNCIAISIGIFDVWLLQNTSGSIETGFYGLAYSIAAMCFLFTAAMTPVISREFSKSFAENDLVEISKLFKRYVPMLYVIATYFSVFIAFEADNLLSIFADERFENAYFALVIFAFYPLHQTYGQINASLFFASDETVKYRNIGLFCSLVGLIFSYFFIYKYEYGAAGFAMKMVLIQLLSVNIQLYFNVKFLKLKLSDFMCHQIYSVVIFSIIAYITKVSMFQNVIYDFILSGIIYTLVFLVFLFLYPHVFGFKKEDIIYIKSLVKF
tara:strand:- start:6294 stop:7775 length:1482 start_codon:yes stop_codon:yes gene_type:complete